MSKGRKRGCPVNITNWLVEIEDKTAAEETWLRIYGLESLTRTTDGETEDGSATTDAWEEPYVTKRSGSASLEGKPVVDDNTGERDAGQAMLTDYAEQVGCDGDATLRFTDPYGHRFVADYVVTSHEVSSDDTEDTESWDLEQVGEAEVLPYVAVSSVAAKDGDTAVTTLSMKVGDAPKVITLAFTPENASNRRFKVKSNKRSVASVSNVNENGFTVNAVAAGTATITVTTVNGAKTTSIAVTVTEE